MFKVGDWIRDGDFIARVTEQDLKRYSKYPSFFIECEPWKPKEGEWCWNMRGQLVKYNSKLMDVFDETYIVEPFIGELPTFAKDK